MRVSVKERSVQVTHTYHGCVWQSAAEGCGEGGVARGCGFQVLTRGMADTLLTDSQRKRQ